MLTVGLKGHKELTVTEDTLATALGSGTQPVFSTPYLLALMEGACCAAIDPYLDVSESSVGIGANISHVSATVCGTKVWCDSELIEVDRKKLTFSVKACDPAGLIGEGTHERFIINPERFLTRAKARQE